MTMNPSVRQVCLAFLLGLSAGLLALLLAGCARTPQAGHWFVREQVNSGCWTIEDLAEIAPARWRFRVRSNLAQTRTVELRCTAKLADLAGDYWPPVVVRAAIPPGGTRDLVAQLPMHHGNFSFELVLARESAPEGGE